MNNNQSGDISFMGKTIEQVKPGDKVSVVFGDNTMYVGVVASSKQDDDSGNYEITIDMGDEFDCYHVISVNPSTARHAN